MFNFFGNHFRHNWCSLLSNSQAWLLCVSITLSIPKKEHHEKFTSGSGYSAKLKKKIKKKKQWRHRKDMGSHASLTRIIPSAVSNWSKWWTSFDSKERKKVTGDRGLGLSPDHLISKAKKQTRHGYFVRRSSKKLNLPAFSSALWK